MAKGDSGQCAVESTADDAAELCRALFHGVGDGIYLIAPHSFRILDVNPAGCADLGMSREEVLQESILSLQSDVMGVAQWRSFTQKLDEDETATFTFVTRHRRKDGTDFPVEITVSQLRQGDHRYLIAVARDITERLGREEKAQERERAYRYALHAASDGLWEWDIATGEVYLNPPLKQIVGPGPAHLQSTIHTWKGLVHADDRERVGKALDDYLQERARRYQLDYRLRRPEGGYLWVHDRGTVVERAADGAPMRFVGMIHDISRHKQLEETLRDIALRDELTGLLNRRAGNDYFRRYLSLSHRVGQEIGVCLLDIDHFKRINDEQGHLIGDQVLRDTAQLLEKQLRRSDVLFRWGGEEFLLLLPDTSLKNAELVANKLRRLVEEAHFEAADGSPLTVTLSAGVSVGPQDGSTIESLVGTADLALYRAKTLGRNRVVATHTC